MTTLSWKIIKIIVSKTLKFIGFVMSSLIGYLVGTAIAWFVIIGDVSPAVVSSLFGIEVRLYFI